MKRYRVGIASMVHDHVWGELRHWANLPNVELVAAADANEELRAKVKAEYGVERLYGSCQEMIEGEELDIVQAGSENAMAADIVEAAAAKGIHVISEKPMSARLSQADRMLAAAQQAGTKLMVNWPNAWNPVFQTLDRLVGEQVVGEPYYVKYRSAHNGPKEIGCSKYFWGWLYDEELNGAGALMDYCCYLAAMAARWLGLPNSCVGIRSVLVKDYPLPDDNAIILAKYDHAFAVAEACWTQKIRTVGPNPIVYGREGAIGIEDGELKIWRPDQDPEIVAPDEPEVGYRNGAEHLIWCIENDEQPRGICNPVVSRNAQEILEAGLVSADTGREVCIPVV